MHSGNISMRCRHSKYEYYFKKNLFPFSLNAFILKIVLATGAGVCLAGVSGWAGTSPTAIYKYLYGTGTVTTAPAFTAFQASGKGGILSCWNPATDTELPVNTALSATNAILACMVSYFI